MSYQEKYLIECLEHHKKNEPRLWWRPESRGYTWDIRAAGRYSLEDAQATCKSASSRNERYWSELEVLTGEAGKIISKPWDGNKLVCIRFVKDKIPQYLRKKRSVLSESGFTIICDEKLAKNEMKLVDSKTGETLVHINGGSK